MRQLTPEEWKVVRGLKDFQFGAFLSLAWDLYPKFIKEASCGQHPPKQKMIEFLERVRDHRDFFWYYYIRKLPKSFLNPVPVEQKAWILLMPKIDEVLKELNKLLSSLSYENCSITALLEKLEEMWRLIQKWNIISDSFKCKLEKMWDELEEREEKCKELVAELSPNSTE